MAIVDESWFSMYSALRIRSNLASNVSFAWPFSWRSKEVKKVSDSRLTSSFAFDKRLANLSRIQKSESEVSYSPYSKASPEFTKLKKIFISSTSISSE